MNDDLKKLLDLQDIDQVIEKIQSELDRIPVQIGERTARIQDAQKAVEEEKKKLTASQLERRNKELEVATQDGAIAKFEKELNSLKSNEAYKAMMGEIEAAKRKKSELEDGILNLMEEFDRLSKELKANDALAKGTQSVLEGEIREMEGKIGKLKAEQEVEFKKRNEFLPQVRADLLTKYEYIRTRKKSRVIAIISGDSCTGCNTNLTQSTINEVKKGRDLILCESCSRILYFPAPQVQTTSA